MRFYSRRDRNVRTLQTICRITRNCPPGEIVEADFYTRCRAFPPEIYENVYEVVGWRARAARRRRRRRGGRKYSRRQRCVLILRNGRLLRDHELFISRSDPRAVLFLVPLDERIDVGLLSTSTLLPERRFVFASLSTNYFPLSSFCFYMEN